MYNLTPNHWINLLPINWRTLEKKWNSKENYQEQLMINIEELIKNCIGLYKKDWELSLLDIWWNNSSAIKDLKNKLIESWIPENKIFLNKIDLDNINEWWVNFINWDLENDDFLIELIEKLWLNKQSIIFMNQVSQYLDDRFKIIKFICEMLLKKWGKFYFNIIPKSFYTWTLPLSIFEEELNKLINNNSSWFTIKSTRNLDLSDFRMYEITKIDEIWTIEFPQFRSIKEVREIDWFKLSTYDFRWRSSLETIKVWIEIKNKTKKNL